MTSRHDEQQQDQHILYGGPEPELIDSTSRSLGEVILKKLAENETDAMFVSIVLICWLSPEMCRHFAIDFCCVRRSSGVSDNRSSAVKQKR